MATGHYARVDHHGDPDGSTRYRLLAGRDPDKDQSYFLYGLRQDQLAHTRFPLGDLTKPEVRAIAHEFGLVTAAKPESQEICFVPDGDYRDRPARRAGWRQARAAHGCRRPRRWAGTRAPPRYTIGQRRGLGVALGERPYVAAIDVAANLIQLGRREDLQRRAFTVATRRSWAARRRSVRFRAEVRIRHRAALVPGRVSRRMAADPPRSAGTSRWSNPSGHPPPARPPSSTPPGRSLAAGASRTGRLTRVAIGPAPLLAALVGIAIAAVFILLLGAERARLLLLIPAAVLGAYAGQALAIHLTTC